MSQSGNTIGDAVKGAVHAIHGAGESIRGNINQGLDQAGEGLRSADSHHDPQHPAAYGKSNDYHQSGSQQGVADKGSAEFKQGIDSIKDAFSSSSSSSSNNNNSSFTSSTTH